VEVTQELVWVKWKLTALSHGILVKHHSRALLLKNNIIWRFRTQMNLSPIKRNFKGDSPLSMLFSGQDLNCVLETGS
jgi:hypothetical protein